MLIESLSSTVVKKDGVSNSLDSRPIFHKQNALSEIGLVLIVCRRGCGSIIKLLCQILIKKILLIFTEKLSGYLTKSFNKALYSKSVAAV